MSERKEKQRRKPRWRPPGLLSCPGAWELRCAVIVTAASARAARAGVSEVGGEAATRAARAAGDAGARLQRLTGWEGRAACAWHQALRPHAGARLQLGTAWKGGALRGFETRCCTKRPICYTYVQRSFAWYLRQERAALHVTREIENSYGTRGTGGAGLGFLA